MIASSRILRADNGAEVPCEELHQTCGRPLVWSLDDRKRLVARQVTGATLVGRQKGFALRLASGRTLEAPADSQPFSRI